MIDQKKIATCHDEIRFTVGDKTGSLCFTNFEIADRGVCYEVESALRSYLLNRSFDDVDIDTIRHFLSDKHEECVEAIADILKWFRPKIKTGNL